MSGDTVLAMMVDLGSLDPLVIRALKKVFKLLIQSSFWCRFSFGCPSYMSSVRCLSFLPHAMGLTGNWRRILWVDLCSALRLTQQEVCDILDWPQIVRSRFPPGHPLADAIVEHRLTTHQSLPTTFWRSQDEESQETTTERSSIATGNEVVRGAGGNLIAAFAWCHHLQCVASEH